MKWTYAWLILISATFLGAPRVALASDMAWTTVGNPGNAADSTGFGAVAYTYSIGTYDVTNSQYVEFLNSNDPDGVNSLGLYNSNMTNGVHGGINYSSGASSNSKYSVISGDGNHPVNYVTYYDSLRFANWLNNGQIPGSTETGAYTLDGGTATPSNASSITRSADATVFLPSENEWYKAAYYNPSSSSYYQYPTSSNTAPTAGGPTANPNSANYNAAVGNLTDVGVYSGTKSPYGAFDMGGNVYQWNEALVGVSNQGVRGGGYSSTSFDMLSTTRNSEIPGLNSAGTGFRVASVVPEPSTAVLAVVACGLMWLLRKRFK